MLSVNNMNIFFVKGAKIALNDEWNCLKNSKKWL